MKNPHTMQLNWFSRIQLKSFENEQILEKNFRKIFFYTNKKIFIGKAHAIFCFKLAWRIHFAEIYGLIIAENRELLIVFFPNHYG